MLTPVLLFYWQTVVPKHDALKAESSYCISNFNDLHAMFHFSAAGDHHATARTCVRQIQDVDQLEVAGTCTAVRLKCQAGLCAVEGSGLPL